MNLKGSSGPNGGMISGSQVAIAVRRNPRETLNKALSKLSEPLPFQRPLERILIKPSVYNPDLPGNTSLELLEAIVYSFEQVAPIYILESDNPVRSAWEAFSESGYDKLESSRVNLVNLSEAELAPVDMPGNFFEQKEMPQLLSGNTFMINLAVPKIEPEVSTYSGAIKNLFGLLPEKDKSVYHEQLSDVLLDLLLVFQPDFSIMDLGEIIIGPRENRETKHLGGVALSLDIVGLDAFCAGLYGFDPLGVDYILRAYHEGIGEGMLDRIQVLGTEYQKEQLMTAFSKFL
jgi:uncharacterized protein (DUF362 family)